MAQQKVDERRSGAMNSKVAELLRISTLQFSSFFSGHSMDGEEGKEPS
jgi:hypothetical protein